MPSCDVSEKKEKGGTRRGTAGGIEEREKIELKSRGGQEGPEQCSSL